MNTNSDLSIFIVIFQLYIINSLRITHESKQVLQVMPSTFYQTFIRERLVYFAGSKRIIRTVDKCLANRRNFDGEIVSLVATDCKISP